MKYLNNILQFKYHIHTYMYKLSRQVSSSRNWNAINGAKKLKIFSIENETDWTQNVF